MFTFASTGSGLSLLNRNKLIAVTKTPQYSFSQVLSGVPRPSICRFSQGNIQEVAAVAYMKLMNTRPDLPNYAAT